MAYENYQEIVGVIQNIRRADSCCNQLIELRAEGEIVQFTVTSDTKIIEDVRLRKGMRIAAFYDTSLPVPAIYPPRYHAELITALRGNQNVTLKYFNEDLVSEDNSLRLNISPLTNMVTLNGQRFTCSPQNMELLVYYTNTTFSILAMTTPQKIIVMCSI